MKVALSVIGFSVLFNISGCVSYNNSSESNEDFEQGSQQAESDLLQGQCRSLDNLGITRYRTVELRAELKKRYGILYKLDHSKSSDYVRGYNVVMGAGAKDELGANYYENALDAVFAERESQLAPLGRH